MKKTLSFILFLLLINICSLMVASAATNPYKQTSSFGTNCTWYAWKMAYEKAGVVLPGFGNAKEWYNDAQRAGYSVGTTPQANSIIVWGDWTSYGHVGYVERVEGNILHVWDSTGPCIDEEDPTYQECMANGVSEETDRACKANAPRVACKYDLSEPRYTITGYIYLNVAPKAPSSSSTNNNQSSSTTTKPVTKSNNANLANIVLNPGNITFNKDTLEYSLEVEHSTDKITVFSTTEDAKAKVTGNGEFELATGVNEIKLTVTAEDGTQKEYKLTITRQEEVKEEIEPTPENTKEENTTEKADNNNSKTLIIVGISVIVVIAITTTSLLMIRKKKNKKEKTK